MKKFLTLVLALVLALGLAAPALAFTSDDADAIKHPYDLDIYLVEYDDNDFFGITTYPPTDRGYAKNEIVAAVVELFVPKGEDPVEDGFDLLVFGGEDVTLNVKDNFNKSNEIELETTSNVEEVENVDTEVDLIDKEIVINLVELAGKNTFKWLFFAKVTDDDASLYAKLVDGAGVDGFDSDGYLEVTLSGRVYDVELMDDPDDEDGLMYVISWTKKSVDYGFMIFTTDKYKSTGMAIYSPDEDEWIALGVNKSRELGIVDPLNATKILLKGDIYDEIMDIYEDVVVDVFGLDYFNIGNYVRKSFFEDIVSADTIIATVDIEPWTAYVVVPDNIVVDPPKTGDAASILGFVMVALSGAGVVALRKRG